MVSVTIVIPAYNEESRLPATLDTVLAYIASHDFSFAEVIVVDDGSRDSTAALVQKYHSTNSAIRLLGNPGNCGKGYAVRNGMLAARGEWVLFTDADLSAPIEELDKLLAAAQSQNASVAIGSRALDPSLISVHQSAVREYSGRFFNFVMRMLTGLPFHDTQCGFKLFRDEAARQIFPKQILDGFSFDVEDLVIAKNLNIKAIEVPVRWSNVEGTKVSFLLGLKSFVDLLKIRKNQIAGKYR